MSTRTRKGVSPRTKVALRVHLRKASLLLRILREPQQSSAGTFRIFLKEFHQGFE